MMDFSSRNLPGPPFQEIQAMWQGVPQLHTTTCPPFGVAELRGATETESGAEKPVSNKATAGPACILTASFQGEAHSQLLPLLFYTDTNPTIRSKFRGHHGKCTEQCLLRLPAVTPDWRVSF